MVGCLVLKFIGSTLVSLAFGRTPSVITNPEYIISFLIAFCLVRSDSIEARELSGHMRYAAPLPVALNLAAALYKMRSLSHLIEDAPIAVGPVSTLLCGTIAFSACNALMASEAWLLDLYRSSVSKAAAGSKPAKPARQSQDIPNLRQTLCRHLFYLIMLMAGHRSGSRLWRSACEAVTAHKQELEVRHQRAWGIRLKSW